MDNPEEQRAKQKRRNRALLIVLIGMVGLFYLQFRLVRMGFFRMSRHGKTVTIFGVLCILAGMTTLTAYAVPLYELFCKVTGYGGTTQVAVGAAKSYS